MSDGSRLTPEQLEARRDLCARHLHSVIMRKHEPSAVLVSTTEKIARGVYVRGYSLEARS